MFGFYRVAAATPKIEIANVQYNTEKILELIEIGNNRKCALIVFPELSITGYTCGDLFLQNALISNAISGIKEIKNVSAKLDIIIAVGAPIIFENNLYNCAVIIHRGKILAIIPKSTLPNYREFYEKRWFNNFNYTNSNKEISFLEEIVPFGTNIIIEHNDEFKLAFEICEDLWGLIPPSSYHMLYGATIIGNLSASNDIIGKSEYRRSIVRCQSAKGIAGYVYSSSGIYESTADLVYGGDCIIAENGLILEESEKFKLENSIIYSDIDCQKLLYLRISESPFKDSYKMVEDSEQQREYLKIKVKKINRIKDINRSFSPTPFIPCDSSEKDRRCEEIFSIQSSSLIKRLKSSNSRKSIIGISGGLDSTLALLATVNTYNLMEKDTNNIISVIMPGFGTSNRTYNNAIKLAKLLNTNIRVIDIRESCEIEFKQLGVDITKHSTAYENIQARQRTKLLMDLANSENGIVIGTGDLSEIALGWSTYNGDHMSMYSLNCGIPKTLTRFLINWYAENKSSAELRKLLKDIIDTPVSPELLPPTKSGAITQKTEDILGPYEIHDFILYHMIKYGASPNKIKYLASLAFKNRYDENTISKTIKTFYKRFFSQQFKRECIPNGPKVGTIALSPRGDWRMPPDASVEIWLKSL